MRRLSLLLATATTALCGTLAAQSSEFGVRGLGVPGRELSTRALSLEGANGLFDGGSSINPASLGSLALPTSMFTSTNTFRSSDNSAGSLAAHDARFPQMMIAGPIPKHHVAIGVSYSLYTDRDFTVVSNGVESPRGVPVGVHDTLSSRGGVDDLRLAAAWIINPHLVVGGGFHFLTGSNRMASRRYWDDTTYLSPQQTAELSYRGNGVSLGVLWQPVKGVELAGAFRHDGTLGVGRDSTGLGTVLVPTSTIGNVDLPTTLSAGVRVTTIPRLSFAGSVISRNWSIADPGIVAQGAIGAQNTIDLSVGAEFTRNAKRPSKLPLRLGLRYATLPFLLLSDPQPSEFDLSIGTGIRFAGDRGDFDLALEHVNRHEGSAFTETAWQFTFGIAVRTGGLGQ
ncbi:MAG TPA: hypothetical protein VHW65_00720 [Gemmatimonadales bacterium]|jgi:hypothetical protein|nr:hypothetical protein [Gemmatimonadales bacterium]